MKQKKSTTEKLKVGFLALAALVILAGFVPIRAIYADDCDALQTQIDALDKSGLAGNANLQPVKPTQGLPRTCTVNALSLSVIKIFLYAAGGIAVVFIMIGGFQYMMGMSTGGDEAIAKAKKTITYAVIGLVIVMLAGTIVIMLYNLITNNSSGTSSSSTDTIFNNGGNTNPGGNGGNPSSGGLPTGTGGNPTGGNPGGGNPGPGTTPPVFTCPDGSVPIDASIPCPPDPNDPGQ